MNKDLDYIKSEQELLKRAQSTSMEEVGLALTSDMSKQDRRRLMREARDALRAQTEMQQSRQALQPSMVQQHSAPLAVC
jgi:type II secretory pathway component HofQ